MNIYLLTILTSLTCLITPSLFAEDGNNPSPETHDESAAIAAEEAAQHQAMEADWTTSAARAGRVRTYRAKVVDQDGKPVPGITLRYSSLTQRADFFSSGIAWTATDGEIVTDAQGVANFIPAPFRKLDVYTWLQGKDLAKRFRDPYPRTIRPCTKYYEDTDSAPRPPDKDGFNMVFEVYRYRGPEKLGDLNRSADIPNDGVERAVALLCNRSGNKEVVRSAERVGPYDFTVTIKRPDVPYWHVAPVPSDLSIQPLRELPPYTLTLTCLNGGIFSVSDQHAIEAPTEGYIRELRWTSPSPPPGSIDENYYGPTTLFWKRGTNPVSYSRLRLKIEWKEMQKSVEVPRPMYANIDIKLLFNRQGGRLLSVLTPPDVITNRGLPI